MMKRIFEQFKKLPIGMGAAAISGEGGGYGFGEISEEKAIDLLLLAHESGVKVFDTAPIYGYGLSEQRIGKAFNDMREEIFIVSKSGITWHKNKRVNHNNDPKIALRMLDQSLIDLQTEYIDLYMIHWPDDRTDIRMPLEALEKEREKGRIKHIGLCNTTLDDLELAAEVTQVEAVQCEYNIFNPKIEHLFPYLEKHDISFMSWGVFDKGIVSGTVNAKRKFDKCDARSWAPWWKKSNKSKKIKLMEEKIFPLIKEEGVNGIELAIGHNLRPKVVDLVLCGVRNPGQLKSAIDSLGNLPSKELITKVLDLVDEL
jgi:myo-inositol catabolism protein IolS